MAEGGVRAMWACGGRGLRRVGPAEGEACGGRGLRRVGPAEGGACRGRGACCVGLLSWGYMLPFDPQTDEKMNEVMDLAHTFLQNFCRGNPQNQVLLHKHLNLFLTPGVSTRWPLTLTVECASDSHSANRVLLTFVRCFPLIAIHSIKPSVSI